MEVGVGGVFGMWVMADSEVAGRDGYQGIGVEAGCCGDEFS